MGDQVVVRKQLTLFVTEDMAKVIENVRRQYNPFQYDLIKSHVTLCREDELDQLDKVLNNIDKIKNFNCTLTFGKPVRVENGKGVLLPAIGDLSSFHLLRKEALKDIIEKPRLSNPHITLLHPRNGTCTNEIFEDILNLDFPSSICFDNIHLIEQCNGGTWQSLHRWTM
jgi:2'-5' RNA ligase